MKHSKLTFIFAVAALFAAPVAAVYAQEAKQAASKPAGEDRSYLGDYADKKAQLAYFVNGKENPVVYKETAGKTIVFTDATGAELKVEPGSDTFKFVLKADKDALNKAGAAYNKGDWESAVLYMRPIVYPIIPVAGLSQGSFASEEYVQIFVDSLLNVGRLNEAYAFAKALPIDQADSSIINAAVSVADALVKKGQYQKALDIVGNLEIKNASQYDASPAVIDLLSALRGAGMVKQILPIYARLGASDNPSAPQFKLWGIFCDALLGNRMTAEVSIGAVKVNKDSDAYPLLKMVQGYLKETDPKKPDIGAALDVYAEGIVFGKVSCDCMPELLYRTGMAYKAMKSFVASNEIFSQIASMYPESQYAKLGAKQMVKIEKKKVAEEVSHEDEDDYDDEEDE